MPAPVTVWAVELSADATLDEVQGSLALVTDALVFTPREGKGPERRFPLADLTRVRRLRGSPVLLVVEQPASGAVRRTAFYFVQPPPLERPDEPRRPTLAVTSRSTTRKVRRRNASYLGLWNREKKQLLREWEREVRAALAAARGSVG